MVLSRGLVADVLTDWVPDAIGAVDAVGALGDGFTPSVSPVEADELTVQMAMHLERLPIIDVTLVDSSAGRRRALAFLAVTCLTV
ncbi:hypothetical protein [Nonomuraea sp. NPDC049646]|uniref:hypothetical protein n=1 Tax=unclassified Nonomuraea TaxID=2593643 RepID=UPI00378CA315